MCFNVAVSKLPILQYSFSSSFYSSLFQFLISLKKLSIFPFYSNFFCFSFPFRSVLLLSVWIDSSISSSSSYYCAFLCGFLIINERVCLFFFSQTNSIYCIELSHFRYRNRLSHISYFLELKLLHEENEKSWK